MVPTEQEAHEKIASDTITCVGNLKKAALKDGIAPQTRFVVTERLQKAINRVKAMTAKWRSETGKIPKGGAHA